MPAEFCMMLCWGNRTFKVLTKILCHSVPATLQHNHNNKRVSVYGLCASSCLACRAPASLCTQGSRLGQPGKLALCSTPDPEHGVLLHCSSPGLARAGQLCGCQCRC